MKAKDLLQRKTLLIMLGLTDIFSRMDLNLPTKWYSAIDTLTVSTGVLHSRLSMVDEKAHREYEELETNVERQLGLTSFYSPEEIEEIKEKVEREVDNKKMDYRPY